MHRLLIVDDEAGFRTMCRLALLSEEYLIDEAEDGRQALTAVHSKRYDIVLLDIDMPGMQGTEVCRRLRENPPFRHLKIIIQSGGTTADEMSQMMLAGADDFLSKPFSIMQLRARVQAALRLKSARPSGFAEPAPFGCQPRLEKRPP